MSTRRPRFVPAAFCISAAVLLPLVPLAFSQKPPANSAGRMLLVPRTVVSGERATLAVLDVSGRLTPGATVVFSNGDRLTTDSTGRALFVAPLTPGVIMGSIRGRDGRVPVTVLSAEASVPTTIEVESIPGIASLTDRLELSGRGFCGGADANQVTIAGDPALVLASSPTSLLIMPPADLSPGRASVDISCGKLNGPPLEVVFVELDLKADSSPLAPGVHRTLTVQVRGTKDKVQLQAKNLAPDIADLTGGNPARVSSSGGAENVAHFEVVGRNRGNFLISIRLLTSNSRAH